VSTSRAPSNSWNGDYVLPKLWSLTCPITPTGSRLVSNTMAGMTGEAFPGVCLVSRRDFTHQRSSGLADRSTGRAWTMDTQSQVASISKQFVAACVLILAERGALDLDDPVSRHLASRPEWDQVSVGQLLTHSSGMSHWVDRPGFVASTPMQADERLRLFLTGFRPRPAGVFGYSSPGYVVLSAVVAAAAERPYVELVHELVITPLGLAATHLNAPGDGPSARGYCEGEPVQPWDLASMPGTGDVWSTAADLAQFVSALHTGGLLPAAVQPLLREVQVPCPRDSSTNEQIQAHSYAAGHFVGTVGDQIAYIHPGDNPGYQSLALWLPESSTAVVVLSNDDAADVESAAIEALREADDRS
jgi:CubicO group peptidase (beta-lactamase class C family)